MKKPWIKRFADDFNFNRVPEVHFWKSEWEQYDPHDHQAPVSPYYFAYRFFFMAWFVGTYIENFACNTGEDNNFYGLYLTNQTYTLQVAYAVLYFIYIFWAFWRQRKIGRLYFNDNNNKSHDSVDIDNPKSRTFHNENYQLPIFCKVLWIIINILNVVPYIVTAIYWMFLFKSHDGMKVCEVMGNLFVHGLNSPMVLLDAFIVAVPIRKTHAVFPILFAIYYTLFSGLYEVFNGVYNAEQDKEYIYPMLNWKNKPEFAIITCVGAYIGAIIMHLVMGWGIYRLRIHLKSKYSKFSNDH